MQNAYMIRSDGKEFPVTVHLYGAMDDPEETLYAAEWLYNHTQFQSVKDLIVKLVAAYAADLDPQIREDNLIGDVKSTVEYQIKHAGYRIISEEFLNRLNFQKIDFKNVPDLKTINAMVNRELNQEFLRARYGGMYDTSGGNSIMYFRVSSVGFNWFPIIWNFVYNNQKQISGVTIVKDPESTGADGYFYKLSGEAVDNMPTQDFLMVSGRPTIDAAPRIAVCDAYPNINQIRLGQKLFKRQTLEIQDQYVLRKPFYKN